MLKTLFFKFFDRGIDWLFRPRNLGIALLTVGLALVGIAFSMDFQLGMDVKTSSDTFSFKFAPGEGMPRWSGISLYVFGIAFIVIGAAIVVTQAWTDIKRERRRLIVVVEIRGLHSSPDTPSKDVRLEGFLGRREWLQVDFRPQRNDELVNPELMLEKVSTILPTVKTLASGRDKRDVFLAVGGLAAVPALFLIGMLVEDESRVQVFDWDRSVKEWRSLNGADDGKRFLPLAVPSNVAGLTEAVLAVSVSYKIDEGELNNSFSTLLPIFHLSLEQPIADRYWSKDKQQELVREFRDAVQILMSHGVKRIHLVLAAQASLSIQMGMSYDSRLMPDLIVYQYEKSSSPPHPWGVRVPTHGLSEAEIVRNAGAVLAA